MSPDSVSIISGTYTSPEICAFQGVLFIMLQTLSTNEERVDT